MATVIKASCHDCGDVELAVDDLEVRVCTQDDQGSYVFRCPSCQMSVVKPALTQLNASMKMSRESSCSIL